jgi:hypothetical protein
MDRVKTNTCGESDGSSKCEVFLLDIKQSKSPPYRLKSGQGGGAQRQGHIGDDFPHHMYRTAGDRHHLCDLCVYLRVIHQDQSDL